MRDFLALCLGGIYLAGCSCQEIQITPLDNKPPTAGILSHETGDQVLEGYTVTVRGTVNDDEPLEELTLNWYVNDDVVCSDPAEDDGATSCNIAIPDLEELRLRLQVRDLDGDVANDSVNLVVQPTASPDVTIFEPVDNRKYYADIPILFEGSITDEEDPPADLSGWWDSSLDGELTSLIVVPNGIGEVSGLTTLSEGEHTITLTGIDRTQKTGSDVVVIDVGPPNSPPSCSITGPDDDGTAIEGDEVTFTATVDDVDVDVDTLMVLWDSNVDGPLSTDPPAPDGTLSFSTTDLSRATHEVSLVVTDDVGVSCTALIDFHVIGPPIVAIVEPAPLDVGAVDTLVTFTATVTDGEDTPDLVALEWSSDLDGIFNTDPADSGGTATFEYGTLQQGTHLITLTGTDTDGMTATAFTTVIIDGPPTAPVVSIDPDPAYTADDLEAIVDVESSDPEGAVVTYRYEWFLDGLPSPASSTETLPSSATARDEVWTVRVIPNDGLHDGPWAEASVTVLNTPPSISGLAIDPDPLPSNEAAIAVPSGWSDDDGDLPDYRYEWKVNGFTLGTDSVLSAIHLDRDDTVQLTVTPDDGFDLGEPMTVTVSVINSAPSATDIVITPAAPTTIDSLTATVNGWSDPDGDLPDYKWTWYVEGGEILGATSNTLSDVYFERGDDVFVEAIPWDGEHEGPVVTSDLVTIRNSAPSVDSVAIIPDPPQTTDTLTAIMTGWDDADDDPPDYQYQWYINDAPVFGATDATLSHSLTAVADEIYVEAYPDDGIDLGDMVTSLVVTVADLPPSDPVVHIEPADPQSSDDLLCVIDVESEDPEGEPISYIFTWTRDTVLFEDTETTIWEGDTVPAAYTAPEQVWVCTVVADDGSSLSGEASDSVTIALPSAVIVSAGQDHSCLVDTTDTAECWGAGGFGRLGLSGGAYIDIGAGNNHTCGIDVDGDIVCAGNDSSGQSDPSALTGTYIAIGVGESHNCAVEEGGDVECWGNNASGESDGMVGNYIDVTAGFRHTCAITSTFGVDCIGMEADGRLNAPAGVSFERIDAGNRHTCGLDLAGTVHCWGANDSGSTTEPGGTFSDVSAGFRFSCGVNAATSQVECWGEDTGPGELYDPPAGSFVGVTCGEGHVCAIEDDGGVLCWGDDTFGESSAPSVWW